MKLSVHPRHPSTILLGRRVVPQVPPRNVPALPGTDLDPDPDSIEEVLVAVAKATYAADDPTPTPLAPPEPIRVTDEPFNALVNPDFDQPPATDGDLVDAIPGWQAVGTQLRRRDLADPAHPNVLDVLGDGSVTQRVRFDQPLGGRTFSFAFHARSEQPVNLAGIAVRSSSGENLLASAPSFPVHTDFQQQLVERTWSAGLADTEVVVELRGVSATNAVTYDQVQLHEGRFGATGPPFNEYLRREHDLAPFKPFADVVVLGAPAPPPPPAGAGPLVADAWTERVRIGATVMTEVFDDPATRVRPFTFGWERRTVADRRGPKTAAGSPAGHAGFYGAPGADPVFDPRNGLPIGYNDTFANGGRYTAAHRPSFDHPPPGATVEVSSTADYVVGAGSVTATSVRRLHLPAAFPAAVVVTRDRCGFPVEEAVPMHADTVVFDKDAGSFTVTWRGARVAGADVRDRLVALRIEGGA